MAEKMLFARASHALFLIHCEITAGTAIMKFFY